MNNIVNEALIPFKDAIKPLIEELYAKAQEAAEPIREGFKRSTEPEDKDTLAEFADTHDRVLHNLLRELDILDTIGQTRTDKETEHE